MHPNAIVTDDIDELFSWADDWDGRYWQLEPGPLGYRAIYGSLPGARVGWHCYERPIFFQEAMSVPGAVLLVSTAADRPGVYRGQEARVHSCTVIRPGLEIECASSPRQRTLEVYLEPPLFDALDWAGLPGSVLAPEERTLVQLFRICHEVCGAANGGRTLDQEAFVLRAQLLVAVRRLLAGVADDGASAQPSVMERPSSQDLVRAARRILEDHMALPMLRVGDLASRVGVAKRTLYSAFQRFVGVGPYEFQVVLRMHAMRQTLLTGRYARGRVRQAGADVGIEDPVMISKAYRRCFGESPRETLRRRRCSLPPATLAE